MKKVLLVILACAMILAAGCKMKPADKGSLVAGLVDDFQIAVQEDGSVGVQGHPDEIYDFTGWKNIKSISLSYTNAAGVKNDGTVVVTGSSGACGTQDWQDIVMAESTYDAVYGLTKGGKVIHANTGDFAVFNSDLYNVVDGWEDIKYIDAEDFGIVGIKGIGDVVAATVFDPELQEEIEEWQDVVSISISFSGIAAVTRSGDVLAAHGALGDLYDAYTEPYEDIKGAVKVCLGETFVAGLMPDGTVTVRSLFWDGNAFDEVSGGDEDSIESIFLKHRNIDRLTRSEREAVHQYTIEHMPEDLKAIDDAADIIDINSYNDTLVALKTDGTILVAGTFEEDD